MRAAVPIVPTKNDRSRWVIAVSGRIEHNGFEFTAGTRRIGEIKPIVLLSETAFCSWSKCFW